MGTVVGIAGSPRKNGNSATLMRAVLKGAALAGAETKEIYLNGLTLKGCQGCAKCKGDGDCIFNDELTPVLKEIQNADGWVLASPIYYDGVTGQMKTFFDRCRTFTKDPESQALTPQLEGKRKAVVIVTYADKQRDDYYHEAGKLANYLGWMGDFGCVQILSEDCLGDADAASGNTELLTRTEQMGKDLFA